MLMFSFYSMDIRCASMQAIGSALRDSDCGIWL
jgi:hypothetical protein